MTISLSSHFLPNRVFNIPSWVPTEPSLQNSIPPLRPSLLCHPTTRNRRVQALQTHPSRSPQPAFSWVPAGITVFFCSPPLVVFLTQPPPSLPTSHQALDALSQEGRTGLFALKHTVAASLPSLLTCLGPGHSATCQYSRPCFANWTPGGTFSNYPILGLDRGKLLQGALHCPPRAHCSCCWFLQNCKKLSFPPSASGVGTDL